MINNDILIRLRYALDIKDKDMVKIFELGGISVTIEDVQSILTKPSYEDGSQVEEDNEGVHINNREFEQFLNGLIIYKRGKQEQKPGQPDTPPLTNDPVNNSLLKKVKIALQLTSEDVIDIFENAGITVTKGELSALLRKKDHKNFKECGDKYARNFLKGLTVRYRG
ncbi:DUF1456 family protein [Gracilibacillus kekensis]|uniref:Uncharacterized conserved protein YehS, DUF1456 family n=1 Tax=Gracilibacillus kekensis TaxID=1027249 RepID=A0A1M7Q070_9BACI|nr:DUF1456 family protein [Gracilibacillus kekensis]SHN23504.1 Uncharacterized conserved protein YehS, DUF1456 family [Gracilibacillus kekensis]